MDEEEMVIDPVNDHGGRWFSGRDVWFPGRT